MGDDLTLWIEHAHRSMPPGDRPIEGMEECSDAIRTFQTKDQFCVVLASGLPRQRETAKAASMVEAAMRLLERDVSPDDVLRAMIDRFAEPSRRRLPLSILHIVTDPPGTCRAHLADSDAPPLFLTRRGKLVLLPVFEDDYQGHLIRTCRFSLQDGDYLAIVSEGYVRVRGKGERWAWKDIANYTRRLTSIGSSAEQLLEALFSTYRRLAEAKDMRNERVERNENDPPSQRPVSAVAMRVRPLRSVTVWTGPPKNPAQDEAALAALMAEPDTRIICGDTTAKIAARLLGAELELEPRPEGGWAQVPPTMRLEGVNLVTEGLVTMGQARQRIIKAQDEGIEGLPRTEDGATRLARSLLAADRIHFIVGLAINPAQVADPAGTIPLRQPAVTELIEALNVWDKLVIIDYT